jgi:hypothetical protein
MAHKTYSAKVHSFCFSDYKGNGGKKKKNKDEEEKFD